VVTTVHEDMSGLTLQVWGQQIQTNKRHLSYRDNSSSNVQIQQVLGRVYFGDLHDIIIWRLTYISRYAVAL
jgi:hypothetical protein